jgi:hypothetical protein
MGHESRIEPWSPHLTATGLLMEGVIKRSTGSGWCTKLAGMLDIGYRKWSTSMMSLFPSAPVGCVYRIQRLSGDTARPTTYSFSKLNT